MKKLLPLLALFVVSIVSCQPEIIPDPNNPLPVDSCRIQTAYYYGGSGGINDSANFIYSIKLMLGKIHTMGTNMKMESIRKVADEEYVFEWMRLTGITATPDWGMPVGTAYDINAVQVSRFRDGKAIEHWEFMQPADMARMMAGNNLQPNLPDTSKSATTR